MRRTRGKTMKGGIGTLAKVGLAGLAGVSAMTNPNSLKPTSMGVVPGYGNASGYTVSSYMPYGSTGPLMSTNSIVYNKPIFNGPTYKASTDKNSNNTTKTKKNKAWYRRFFNYMRGTPEEPREPTWEELNPEPQLTIGSTPYGIYKKRHEKWELAKKQHEKNKRNKELRNQFPDPEEYNYVVALNKQKQDAISNAINELSTVMSKERATNVATYFANGETFNAIHNPETLPTFQKRVSKAKSLIAAGKPTGIPAIDLFVE